MILKLDSEKKNEEERKSKPFAIENTLQVKKRKESFLVVNVHLPFGFLCSLPTNL